MVAVIAQSTFWVDCLPIITAMDKGEAAGRDAKNPLARVHSLLAATWEGEDVRQIGWMPSHLEPQDLSRGMAKKSNGEAVTEIEL